MRFPELSGFDRVMEPPHALYVRAGWRETLLPALRSDFAGVAAGERTVHRHGRIDHFACALPGAPGRVFVRRAVRASAAALLGDLYLGPRRFLKEVLASEEARRLGLAVPEIAGARLTRVGPFFCRYTLVLREVSGAEDLLALSRRAPGELKRRAARHVGAAVRRMHEAGIYHGDLTFKNILVSGAENGLHVYFIDVDRSSFLGRRDGALDVSNLSRLNRSAEKLFGNSGAVSRADKMRFLESYTGSRDEARALARRCGRTLWFHRLWWRLTGQGAR